MPRWFWKVLWGSQVINWIVTIWAYGTPNGSCLLAPTFTIAWVLRHEIADTFKVIFMDIDELEFQDEEEFDSVEIGKRYRYCQLKKGA